MIDVKDKKIIRKASYTTNTRLVCGGIIRKPGHVLNGKPCRKVLGEPNSRGKLSIKIICPRCGFINEV